MPTYELDEDIIDSMTHESQAEVDVKKHKKRFQKQAEEAAKVEAERLKALDALEKAKADVELKKQAKPDALKKADAASENVKVKEPKAAPKKTPVAP